MNALDMYRRHLEASAVGDEATLREIWDADGVVEFPYAPAVGSPERLDGIDRIVEYFTGLQLFGQFTFGTIDVWPLGDARTHWLAELHASSVVLATGRPYEQDYIVRFSLGSSGRLEWMREYWDPTRFTGPS